MGGVKDGCLNEKNSRPRPVLRVKRLYSRCCLEELLVGLGETGGGYSGVSKNRVCPVAIPPSLVGSCIDFITAKAAVHASDINLNGGGWEWLSASSCPRLALSSSYRIVVQWADGLPVYMYPS